MILFLLFISIYSLELLGQENMGVSKKITKLHLISIGSSNIYDNYLSPLEYKGINISYNYIYYRDTNWFDKRFVKYQNIGIDLSKANNPHGNASFYWALVNFQLGGHYFFRMNDKLNIGIGALGNTSLGVLYSDRNGNNPATGRFYVSVTPSLVASYALTDKIPMRLQLDFDLLGCYFQPEYGQSYYEIYLGNRKDILNFSSFHNIRHLKSYLSTELSIGKRKFQFGLIADFIQTKIHHTITHNYSLNISVGFPLYSIK